jgi:hypothetical protein
MFKVAEAITAFKRLGKVGQSSKIDPQEDDEEFKQKIAEMATHTKHSELYNIFSPHILRKFLQNRR